MLLCCRTLLGTTTGTTQLSRRECSSSSEMPVSCLTVSCSSSLLSAAADTGSMKSVHLIVESSSPALDAASICAYQHTSSLVRSVCGTRTCATVASPSSFIT